MKAFVFILQRRWFAGQELGQMYAGRSFTVLLLILFFCITDPTNVRSETRKSSIKARSGSISPQRKSTDRSQSARVSIQQDAMSKATTPRNAGIRKRSPGRIKGTSKPADVLSSNEDDEDECDIPGEWTHQMTGGQRSLVPPALSEAEIFEAEINVPEARISRQKSIKLQERGPKCLSVRTDIDDSHGPSTSSSRRNDAPTPELLGRLSIKSPAAATTRFVSELILTMALPILPPCLLCRLSSKSPRLSAPPLKR